MRRMVGALVLGHVAALSVWSEAASAGAEDRVRRDLSVGEAAELGVLEIARPTVFEVVCDRKRVVVRATPEGMIEFLEAGVPVNVTVTGVEGNRARFTFRQGDRVSVWPVSRVEIRGGDEAFSARVAAADWAFVVRAEKVQGDKLSVDCDGIPCELRAGQRLDVDRERGKTVFRAIGRTWPGRLVEAREPPPGRPPRPPKPPRPPVDTVASAVVPLPFIAAGWGAWEVEAALAVSP